MRIRTGDFPRPSHIGSVAVGVVTIALATGVAGCGSSSHASSGGSSTTSGGTAAASRSLTIGDVPSQTTLDGIFSNDVPTTGLIYNPLVQISSGGQLTPALATKWTSNQTSTVWTFTLRKGVTFQNGMPFTAQDVVWTYRKDEAETTSLVGPNVSPYLAPQDVTAKGADKIVFKLKTPTPTWPRQTSLVPILPEQAYNAKTFANHPIGTGPWEVVSYSPNASLTLKANPRYWGGAPAYKHVTFDYLTDETARLNALRSGSISLTELSAATLSAAKSDSSLSVSTPESNLVEFLGYDVKNPALSNVKMRQAVDMAVDRSAIVKSLFGGAATATGQLVAPSTFGYSPSLKATAYNPSEAKKLVQESGYKGQTINLVYPNGTLVPEASQVAQTIAAYLQAVGIKVSITSQQQATFLSDWFGKKFSGIYLFSFQPSTADAILVYNLLMHTANYFTDPQLEALFAKQSDQSDSSARLSTLVQMARYIQQKAYFSPLLVPDRVYAYDKSKVVPQLRPDGYFFPQFAKLPGSP